MMCNECPAYPVCPIEIHNGDENCKKVEDRLQIRYGECTLVETKVDWAKGGVVGQNYPEIYPTMEKILERSISRWIS